MFFSKSCEYAIQALLYLTVKGDGRTPIHLRTITSDLRIPHHFLSKVLQILSKDEIIASHRGSNGGFLLARHPSQITLLQVAIAVDGNAFLDHCVLGYSKCNEHDACPAHGGWTPVKKLFFEMIENTTFETMSREWNGNLDKLGVSMPKLQRFKR